MNFVQPIRDIDKIREIRKTLQDNPRDELLFCFGIYSGLRISDIFRLKVGDVRHKHVLFIKESRYRKRSRIRRNDHIKGLEDIVREEFATIVETTENKGIKIIFDLKFELIFKNGTVKAYDKQYNITLDFGELP